MSASNTEENVVSSSTIFQILHNNKDNEEKPILIHENEQLTYSDIYHKVIKYVSYLQNECGIEQGDKIMIISRQCIPCNLLFIVNSVMNTTAIPINCLHSQKEFQNALDLTKPKIIFFEKSLFHNKDMKFPFDDTTNIEIKTLDEIDECDEKEYNLKNTKYVNIGGSYSPNKILSTGGTTGMFKMVTSDVCNYYRNTARVDVVAAVCAEMVYPPIQRKNGTQFEIKKVMERNIFGGLTAILKRLIFRRNPINLFLQSRKSEYQRKNGMKSIVISPTFHGPGSLAAVASVIAAETLILPFPLKDDFKSDLKANVSILFDKIMQHKVNHVTGNTMWYYELYNLLNNMEAQRKCRLNEIYKLNETLTFTILGENIPLTLLRNFMKALNNQNIGVRNFYGSTESGILGISDWISTTEYDHTDLEEKYYYFPLPTTIENLFGRSITFNENDEILVKTLLTTGDFKYIGNDRKTKESFDENGYFIVGDRCMVDKESNKFRFIQRRKDIIQTFGYIIYPEIIENILLKNEYVFSVVVIGVEYNVLNDDENRPNIETPIAFIQLNDKYYSDHESDKSTMNEQTLKVELFELCERELNKEINEIPEQIHFIDHIPITKGCKKDRNMLKQYFIQTMIKTTN